MAAWGRGQEAVRSISTPRERRLQKPDLWTQLLSRQSAHHRVSSVVLEPSQDCATVGSRAFRHPASAVMPTAARPPRAVTQAPSTGSRPPWTITRAGRTLWPWLPLPHPPTEGGASSPAMSPALGLRCRRGGAPLLGQATLPRPVSCCPVAAVDTPCRQDGMRSRLS